MISVSSRQAPDNRAGERSTVRAFVDFERSFSALTGRGVGREAVSPNTFCAGRRRKLFDLRFIFCYQSLSEPFGCSL